MVHENDEIEREEGDNREWDADRILGHMREKGIASVTPMFSSPGRDRRCEAVDVVDASGRHVSFDDAAHSAFLKACEKRADQAIAVFSPNYPDDAGCLVDWTLTADGCVRMAIFHNEVIPRLDDVWEGDWDHLEPKPELPKDKDLDPARLLRDATAVLRDLLAGYRERDLHCNVDELMKKLGRYYREVVGDAEILPAKEAEESSRDDSAPGMR